jgi:MerR family transcriptional regulator, light-induced transcriptional regulator
MLSWRHVSDERNAQTQHGLPFLPPVDPAVAGPLRGAGVTAEAFAGFLADGDEEIARWALSSILQVRPRAAVYDSFVREAMRLVGERWAAGRWTISEEHLASRTLARVLTSLAPAETPADRVGPTAVLAGVAGEEHSIGLMALSHVLTEAGFAVADLGSDVPAQDLVLFAAKTEARLVALSATTSVREEVLRDTIAAVGALPTHPVIIVGGRIAEVADLADMGADWAGTSLVDCARYATELSRRLAQRSDPV